MAVASRTWTTSYGRYVQLRITAQEVEVDVPNNRSKVRVTGQIYYPGGSRASNYYPQTYTVTVDGTQIGRQTSITYNLASGASMNLTTYTSGWINHNSNGAKTVTVRGHITDGAGDTGTISQSYALTTIARASTLSSFSMPNHLKPSTTTSFSLGIARRSSSFTHDIQLRDGTTVIASWTGQGTPTALSLTTGQTNTLLSRMGSSTSRTMTLRVQTKSGSTNIGGALTRTATVYVHSSVTPNVSGLSVAIQGNAHAKDNVKRFVQNISKVSGSFTRSATGGASISSSKLEIRRKSGGSDLQSINSNSGTFPRVVALSGQYQARGTATDSRGRSSNTGWVDLSNFNVLTYSTPQITKFSTDRRTGIETTVDIARHGTHSGLSGSNVLTITLQQRASETSSWTNVVNNVTTTSNTFGATVPSTGHSVASSYEFRLYIVDQFGNSAEQISTVSTQRVVLDIHKNEGVGIGKIHEEGVLDVDGSAYFKGDVQFLGGLRSSAPVQPATVPMTEYPSGISMFASAPAHGYPQGYFTAVNFNESTVRSGQLIFGHNGSRMFFRGYRVDDGWSEFTEVAGLVSGYTTSGGWMRFNDGTQICYGVHSMSEPININAANVFRGALREVSYPVGFSNSPHVVMSTERYSGNHILYATLGVANSTRFTYLMGSNATFGPYTNGIRWYAIGRWK